MECENTGKTLWRNDDSFEEVHLIKDGMLGIGSGGTVFVKSIRGWVDLASKLQNSWTYGQYMDLMIENEMLTKALKEIQQIIPKGGSKYGRPDYVTSISGDKVKEIHEAIEKALAGEKKEENPLPTRVRKPGVSGTGAVPDSIMNSDDFKNRLVEVYNSHQKGCECKRCKL